MLDDIDTKYEDGAVWVKIDDVISYITESSFLFAKSKDGLDSIIDSYSTADRKSVYLGFATACRGIVFSLASYSISKHTINSIDGIEDLLELWK